jgi:plastocyanin
MTSGSRLASTLAAAAALLAPAAGAHAATYTVHAGERAVRPALPAATQNRYMPATVEVHVGDRVRFRGGVRAEHTVAFLGRRPYARHALTGPERHGATYGGVRDVTGEPFPFNGRPRWVYNLLAAAPVGEATVDGRRYVASGFLPPASAPGVTYRFPRRGTYTFNCLVHPGMTGKVVVRPKRARIASPRAVARRAAALEAAGWTLAERLAAAPVETDTVLNGPAAPVPGGDVTLLEMRPAQLTIPVGSKVAFRTDSVTERHNAALGPADFIERYLGQQSSFPRTPLDQNRIPGDQIYGTEPPGPNGPEGPFPFDGTNNGNGFLSLAATDASPRTQAFGPLRRITFTAPGTYVVHCLLHYPQMRTTVTVVP